MVLRTLLVTVAGVLIAVAPVRAAEKPTAAEVLKINWVNPPRNAPEGVTHHTFRSRCMDVKVGYNIYLPPAYQAETKRRFPVVYFLHGSQGNESRSLHAAETLHAAITAGQVEPMLMVFANGGRNSGYIDSVDGTVRPVTMIIEELIPHIDATYRTRADRGGRGIEGFSMGGGGALRLALLYPEMFGSVVVYGAGGMRELDEMPTAEDIRSPGNAQRKMEMRKIVHGEDLAHLRETSSYYIAERQRGKVAGRLPIRVTIGTGDFSLEGAFATQGRLAELRIPHEFEMLWEVPHNIQQLYQLVGLKGLRHHEAVFRAAQAEAGAPAPGSGDAGL